MHADAKHEQDHTHFGELGGHFLIGDETWRERTEKNAGERISDKWGNAKAVRHRAENEGEDQSSDDQ